MFCPSCIDSHEYSRYIAPRFVYTLDKVDIDGYDQYHIGIDGFWDGDNGSEGLTGIAVDGVYLYLEKSHNSYSCIKMDTTDARMSKSKWNLIHDIVYENRIERIPSTIKLIKPQVFFDSLARVKKK